MGLFSASPKMPFDDLDDILRDVPGLRSHEQEYVKGLFTQYRAGGISKREVERAIRELKRDGDVIGDTQANQIKETLLSYLNREEE